MVSAAIWSEPPQDPHERLGGKVSIDRGDLPGREPARVPLRLVAWGDTGADVEKAVSRAGFGPGRARWEFVEVERLTGAPCPLDLDDPAAIAAEGTKTWAYTVHRAQVTS